MFVEVHRKVTSGFSFFVLVTVEILLHQAACDFCKISIERKNDFVDMVSQERVFENCL